MARPLFFIVFFALLLSACGGAARQAQPSAGSSSSLPDLGLAPELTNSVWINSDHAVRLADLRGKVVLLEMWTFGCINCQHTLPTVIGWHQQFSGQGLVVIGNHFPEFAFEADLDNLREAVQQAGIRFAVAQDNEGATWRAYQTHYWPTIYLIDRRGHLRFTQIGEGGYARVEQGIRDLLAE